MNEYQEAYRNHLDLFIEAVFKVVDPDAHYMHNWHIELIAEYLKACQRGEIKRLIINIPPRYMKSICVSVAFPAWLLGHNPSESIICASYATSLAHKHSTNCRAVIEHPWYQSIFPETKLADDQNTKTKFMTTKRGFRYATSVGGSVMGDGANFLIVDDALKADEALSQTKREAANTWFDQSYSTRLNDRKKGCIIVIGQRLHEEDLSGHLLAKGGWEHLNLPLIAQRNETFCKGCVVKVRNEGELLHPARDGEPEIEILKKELGPYGFAGQYQQNPAPLGGGEFKREWIQFYDGRIDHTNFIKYMCVDPANSKKKYSDYTAICVLGLGSDNNIYLLDMVRDKLDLKERENMLFELHAKYKPKYVYYERYGMQADVEFIKSRMEYRNYRFPIIEVAGTLSKEDRIRRLVPYFADNRVWLPRTLVRADYTGNAVDLTESFINEEYLTFPVGLHDDMFDAISRICDKQLIFPNRDSNIDYSVLRQRVY